MVGQTRYFTERPAQASRVIDAVLADPAWSSRLPAGRIGALGHSAGGYTVLALAGAEAVPRRAAEHCRTVSDDPGFCQLARRPETAASSASAPEVAPASMRAADARVRAVVALAPMAVVFSEASLAAVRVPTRIVVGPGPRAQPRLPRRCRRPPHSRRSAPARARGRPLRFHEQTEHLHAVPRWRPGGGPRRLRPRGLPAAAGGGGGGVLRRDLEVTGPAG